MVVVNFLAFMMVVKIPLIKVQTLYYILFQLGIKQLHDFRGAFMSITFILLIMIIYMKLPVLIHVINYPSLAYNIWWLLIS